ncbi:MAG: hypothetical protein OES90_03395, partial [Xanthomonadales bacterium]|nr:hypothetical protein [Xanthomonadales bacterium]
MNKIRRKKALRFLESGFLVTGLILLTTFVLARVWGDYQSKSDILAFEQAIVTESAPADTLPGDKSTLSDEPDYTLWSSKRIDDYHKSLTQRDDAPLAVLSIDKLALKVPVYNGTDEINL